jgi:Fe-S-cluster containining protein
LKLQDLYALIPEVQCLPDCTVCCRAFGIPSQTKIETRRIKSYLKKKGIIFKPAEGTTCPYVSDQGCTIYPVRPFICRLFGTAPNLLCQLGARPLTLLHEDEEEEIWHHYRTSFF